MLGGAAYLLFKGGGVSAILPGHRDDSIPNFDFKLAKTSAVPTSKTEASALSGPAAQVATAVTAAMKSLYTEAFLDPANWRDGSYDEVWPLFEDAASQQAQTDGAALTLGANAGDAYDKVEPSKAKVSVRVLFDEKDTPTTAVAIVEFTAIGTGKDGTLTAFVSSGQYFLRDTGDGWKVFSYSLKRADHPAKPKPGPSGSSSSPTAVAS